MELFMKKKELKRIDWDIVKRILGSLYDEDKAKKTHISMKCKISYDNCVLYLNWMELLDLVKKERNEHGSEFISLSERGRELWERKFTNKQSCVIIKN